MAAERSWGRRMFGRWAHGVARRRLRRLDRVDVVGIEHLAAALKAGPVVAAANHVCWWDALVILRLTELLGGHGERPPFSVLVDQESMERYPFFAALGGVGVDRHSRIGARAGLRRAASVLVGPGDLLWVFPQGKYCPVHQRPLGLEAGVAWLARHAAVVPVALDYPFLQSPQPGAFVTIGAPVAPDRLEAELVSLIDAGAARAAASRFALIPAPTMGSRALNWLFGGRS